MNRFYLEVEKRSLGVRQFSIKEKDLYVKTCDEENVSAMWHNYPGHIDVLVWPQVSITFT